ncbi:acyltransferase [Sphingobacteriales bacterium UPWRP_1]|nr:acetyltransferase [Sphingobacteriales bacterium TSM_CSS]PSJ77374.1 acyltransferase [Sphingobacteriales bacterium UPWRP_1]
MNRLKQFINSKPTLKAWVHWLLVVPNRAKPRLWVRLFINPFVHKRGNGSRIGRYARLDVLPFNPFTLGSQATIEDFATINNGLGAVHIGNNSLVGLSCVVIGPVIIGNEVMLAQNIVLSGLNHTYQNVLVPIRQQPCTTAPIVVEDEVWIGANAVITAGVTIGKHAVVAAGSVVTRNVPPYSVVAGNPAKVVKQYNPQTNVWEKAEQAGVLYPGMVAFYK